MKVSRGHQHSALEALAHTAASMSSLPVTAAAVHLGFRC